MRVGEASMTAGTRNPRPVVGVCSRAVPTPRASSDRDRIVHEV